MLGGESSEAVTHPGRGSGAGCVRGYRARTRLPATGEEPAEGDSGAGHSVGATSEAGVRRRGQRSVASGGGPGRVP